MKINYFDLKKEISNLVPRTTCFEKINYKKIKPSQKFRKTNLHRFSLEKEQYFYQDLKNNLEESYIKNFIEISTRAMACPMPLNVDVWDGMICSYNCIYCFSNLFRHSLYSSFFSNWKQLKIRNCNPDIFKKELEKYFKNRALNYNEKLFLKGENKAIALEMPFRVGIRYENFLKIESEKKITLELMKFLSENEYPYMINTKSNLIKNDNYLFYLKNNKAKTAVHVTLISSNEKLLQTLEPGAPSYKERLEMIKILIEENIKVILRIEPWMFLINDNKEDIERFINDLKEARVKEITFDSFSYSAKALKYNFVKYNFDFDRMFELSSEIREISSLLLSSFIELFINEGFHCGTFDYGSSHLNSQLVCCQVGDYWDNSYFNVGSGIGALHFIRSQNGNSVSWKQFEDWVNSKGGFLSEVLKKEVWYLWNLDKNSNFSEFFLEYALDIEPCGWDDNGIIWRKKDNFSNFYEKIKIFEIWKNI